MTSVREAVFDLLQRHGMTTVFGNPGSTEMPFLNEMPDGFRYILGLQEGAVVAMADGYAQATAGPTLVNLHSGPGVGNAMGSIINARANRSPLVITAGTQVRPMQAMEAWLTNVRATELPQPAVKWSGVAARAADTPAVLARAIHEASLPPTGPVFVSQPMDDWAADVTPAESKYLNTRKVVSASGFDQATAAAVAARIDDASAPLLVLGSPLDSEAGWRDSVALAEKAGMAVMLAPVEGRWSFPGWHPNFRGTLLPAIAAAAAQLAAHDLVVVVGAPVLKYYPYMPGELLPEGTELVQITDDQGEASRAPMGDAYIGDPTAAVAGLLAAVSARPSRVPGPPQVPAVAPSSSPLSPADAYSTIAAVMPDDVAVVSESPSNLMVMLNHWRPSHPRSFFFSGSGGLGFGTSATVGVQLGLPNRPVVGILGDGAFQYSVQGLYTAALYNIPATFLVLRNSQYAILKWFGEVEGAPKVPGLDLPDLDAVPIAEGYGVPGRTVSDSAALADALTEALGAEGPRLIQVDIDGSREVM